MQEQRLQINGNVISNVVRWIVVGATFIISLVLLASWILWMTTYNTVITNSLKFFSDKTIIQGYGISFDFLVLSIITLGTALFSFMFGAPLIFYRKKSGLLAFIALLDFILAAIIIVGSILFAMTSYAYYGEFFQKFGLNDTLITFLPWAIAIFFAIILIFSSLWTLISSANNISSLPLINSAPITTQDNKQYEEPKEETTPISSPKPKNTIVVQKDKPKPKHKPHKKEVPKKKKKAISTINTPIILKTENYDNNKIEKVIKEKLNNKAYKSLTIEQLAKNLTNHQNTTQALETNNKTKIIAIKWTKKQINEAWEKGKIIKGVNPELYRKDYAGAWMFYKAFTTDLEETDVQSYAWTIVCYRPLSHKGTSEINNLDPMNVINAITKGKSFPKWKTKISSYGNENIIKEQSWTAKINN